MLSESNDDTTTSTNINDSNDDLSKSPTEAGVTRGALKTAATSLSKRVAVGPLPKSAPSSSTMKAITNAAMKKAPKKSITNISKLRKLRRGQSAKIAKVSDRLSTSYDVLSVASDSSSNKSDHHGGKLSNRERFQYWFRKSMVFSSTMVKNTILGAAVFDVFEKYLSYFDKIFQENHTQLIENVHEQTMHDVRDDDNQQSDIYSRASLTQHFIAGGCAGSVHSLLSIVIFPPLTYLLSSSSNVISSLITSSSLSTSRVISTATPEIDSKSIMKNVQYRSNIWDTFHNLKATIIPPSDLIRNSLKHHVVAHSILFGTYQLLKRSFESIISISSDEHDFNTTTTNDTAPPLNLIDPNHFNIDETITKAAIIGTAGGIAGQIQHIISHHTEKRWNIHQEELWINKSIQEKLREQSSNHNKNNINRCNHATHTMKSIHDKKYKPITTSTSSSRSNYNSVVGPKRVIYSLPSSSSILFAFIPSAIGFIAFEFGKELIV